MRAAAASLLALLGAGACGVDYGLEGKEFGNQGAGDPDPDPPLDTGYLSPFGCAEPSMAGTVAPDESCEHEEDTGPLDAMVEWSMREFNSYGVYNQVVMAPAVGQLTDDNLDGVIDRWDIPDIVIITDDEGEYTHKKGVLRIIPGDGSNTGAALLRADVDDGTTAYQVYPYRYSNVALGDIDGDGLPEIVAIAQVFEGPSGGPGGGAGSGGAGTGTGTGGGTGTGSGPGPGTGSGTGSGDTYVSFDSDETGLPGGPTDTASSGPGSGTGGSTGTGTGAGTGGAGAGGGASGEGTSSGGGEGDIPVRPIVPDPRLPDGRSACQVVAFAVSGDVKWIAHDLELPCGGHAPALGDLEGDGVVEVVVGDAVMDGRNGSILWEGGAGKGAYPTHPEVGYHTVIADLEGDGLQEVITGRTLYDATGTARCGFATEEEDGFAGVADLDLDGVGEVVSIGGGIGRVIEADCTVVSTFTLVGGGNGGPPTIADYDTDGVPEIGVAEADTYSVYESDGTVLWSMPVDDASSHVTGSVVFDFEGDARPEVVYADETRLWVFDGLTGAVRLEDTNHASRTLHEFPTVADVDADGQTEIIVPCGGGHEGENQNGLYVLGSESGSWVPSRQVWNQHAYSITNVEDDLAIPSLPTPNWPTYNNFRSGDLMPAGAGRAADGVPLAEVCLDECEVGRVIVFLRLGNAGAGGLRYGVPMSLYAEDVSGYRTFIKTIWVPDIIDVGSTSETLRVSIDSAWLENQYLIVVADDEAGVGWVPECNEDNNELRFDIEEVSCGG